MKTIFTSKLCLKITNIKILNSPTETHTSKFTRFFHIDAKDEQNGGVMNAAACAAAKRRY